jgi:hypothetical protein
MWLPVLAALQRLLAVSARKGRARRDRHAVQRGGRVEVPARHHQRGNLERIPAAHGMERVTQVVATAATVTPAVRSGRTAVSPRGVATGCSRPCRKRFVCGSAMTAIPAAATCSLTRCCIAGCCTARLTQWLAVTPNPNAMLLLLRFWGLMDARSARRGRARACRRGRGRRIDRPLRNARRRSRRHTGRGPCASGTARRPGSRTGAQAPQCSSHQHSASTASTPRFASVKARFRSGRRSRRSGDLLRAAGRSRRAHWHSGDDSPYSTRPLPGAGGIDAAQAHAVPM